VITTPTAGFRNLSELYAVDGLETPARFDLSSNYEFGFSYRQREFVPVCRATQAALFDRVVNIAESQDPRLSRPKRQ